jgi:hypothetical protein
MTSPMDPASGTLTVLEPVLEGCGSVRWPGMGPALVLHVCGAACAIALGVMLVVVTSVLFGSLLIVGGGAWLARALRHT